MSKKDDPLVTLVVDLVFTALYSQGGLGPYVRGMVPEEQMAIVEGPTNVMFGRIQPDTAQEGYDDIAFRLNSMSKKIHSGDDSRLVTVDEYDAVYLRDLAVHFSAASLLTKLYPHIHTNDRRYTLRAISEIVEEIARRTEMIL